MEIVEGYDPENGRNHQVTFFKHNPEEMWASVRCKCGWEVMAGSIIEVIEEYRDHTDVLVQMEKYLEAQDGNVSSEVEPGSASSEGELS